MSNNVEAIYPLSPMQEGMLFHTAYAPGTGVYVNQVAYTFGGLEPDAFRRAWQAALDRHGALRSAFLWEKRDRPLQAVLRAVELPWDERDWRGLDAQARQAALEALMHEDRTRGFALNRAPAMRLYVLRTGDDEHRVLWSFHHLVLDGWSMSLLLGEVFRLYDALRRGESPALPPAPQYRAYITWLQAQRPADAEAFWRGALAGVEGPTPLGVDRGDAAVNPGDPARYAQLSVPIPPETAAAVQAFARRAQLTANTVVQGAWALLLSRYGGSPDVVFGVTMSGRPAALAGAEQTVGLFINTLPARVAVPEEQGVLPWLRDVQRRHAELQQHGHVPLVQVHGWSAVPRDQPLFETVLAFQNFPSQRAERQAGGLQVRDVKVSESPGLPVTVSVGIGAESFLKVMYDRTRVTDETAARLPAHFKAALDAIAAGAERRVGELEVLGAEERALVLEEWNRTAAEYPADRCIHELFEVQAARTPGAIAVVHEGEALSYAQLNARANQLAHHLRRRGVGPEVRVGICLERSLELVVSLLAVLKAGGAYVPLDPGYPAERLERIAADAGLALLLTAESLRGAVPAPAGLGVVYVDAAWPVIAAESTENPESGAGPNTLAYVIYTSGSTGTPKGVAVQHASMVSHMSWFIREFQVGPRDRVLQKTPISFDASVWEFHVPLLAGARLVLAAPGGEREPRYLARTVGEQGITLLQLVPALLRVLADEPELPECGALRLLFCGGEALEGELARRAGELLPAARVVNLYGPTECCIQACTHACVDEDGGLAVVPVGRPVANTRAYVLDPGLRPAAPGVPGELYLGGVQVARGYLGRAALTAERFVPDPFAARPGSRLYRTGDRARWRADGAIEYLGRLDHQVKVRGFRIELGEIEAVLRRHESVADCVVTASEQRLVAYVAGEAGAEALRAHVRHSLPEYMVPSAFVFLEALPLMPNGKLDRKALPEPGALAAASRVAPRNDLEAEVAALFSQILSVPDVGATDSFFNLGGHSLLAMRLVSRVRELFGVELPLRALFDGPTVAEIAGAVEDERRKRLPVLPPVVPTGRTGALPLSFAQERLWFVDWMEPGSAVYNLPAAWRMAGALDVNALERSLGEIVRRHGVLRTVFAEADGSPVQVIAPFGGFALPVEDLSGWGEAEREAAVGRRAGEEARRPFDLAAGPLFRAALLRLGAEEHVLLLSMHHIVSDGWSMGVLYRELAALYAAYGEGRTSPLPELPVQYADYAVWQREQLEGEVLERQLSYWRERLAGAPELLELPTDRPRPAVQAFRGAYEGIELPLQMLERLQALGRSQDATLYMVLLGAFQVLLSKYSGSEDIVVGSPIAGRTRKEAEELIGFFVNTLVLRTDLSGDPGFREVLRRVRQVTLGAYEHQEVPFERLVAELRPERSLSHSPLFQVMFTQQDAAAGGPALPGLEVSGVDEQLESAKFDLALMVKATGHGLRVGVNYSTDLFERGTVVRMLGHLARVLEQVAADADVRLSRLELLGDAERAQVLQAWNRTAAEYPAERCIHELFEMQAARTPRAVAATGGAAALTYAELNARANRLARHLVRLGVGPEARVGVCLERGPELIVCNLAVLKAGGAYVAMDPAYPAARLELMLRDSRAAVLLTDGRGGAPAEQDGVRVVRVDRDAHAWAAESAANLPGRLSPRNVAYVVYTSGSTGTPKGVAVDHASLGALCAWHVRAFGVTAADRGTQVASPGFDAAVWEVWPYLARGASVHVVPEEVRADPPALRDWLVEHGATVSFIPTPVAEPMLALEWPADAPLRWLLTGGDRLRARPRAGMPFALANNYGPTECTVVATSGVVEAGGVRTPAIGGPIENTRVYVLDAALRPLPVCVPGELCIGGAQVARGYLDRPALTAERFVPDPHAEPGARLYRSGDRVRWLPDGTVEYLGRLDEQVKVRGFRIELSEIECALRQAPGVADCAVLAPEDEAGGRRLAAYIVGGAGAEALREHLRRTLPEYMVPSAFVALDALPLTANGKLDRKALPAPELAPAGDRYVAPRTPVEEVLAGIWAEVLRLERVGVEESFFELGGHSLLATRLVSRVRELLGVELPLRALFEGPTVAELAGRVEEMRRAGLPVLPPVLPAGRTGALPLSFAQERLWFIDRLEPESTLYNVPAALRLAGALDEPALERALGEIVRRHEALRTTFAAVDGSPVQVIAPFGGFALPVEDLSGLGEAEREAAVGRRAGEEARRPFDLAAGPLLRAALLRLGAEDHVLLLCMHHILMDHWGMGVLRRELSALYEAYRAGGESPLAELAVQYADYAAWQREQLRGEVLDGHLAYWKERMAGAPALLELPTDRPRPAVQTYRGTHEGITLPGELLARLEALGRGEGATLFMTLLAAFQVLLSKYSGSEDVVVGSPVSGRTRREVEELIGLFLNTLVLRTDLSGDPSFREVLRRVREMTLGAFEHQEIPFERLVTELQPGRSLSYSPLFQVMFVLQEAERSESAAGSLELRSLGAASSGTSKFDLTLFTSRQAGRLTASLEYNTDLFDRGTILRMLGHLRQLLEEVAADADVRLSRLQLLGDAERRQVVAEWNATDAAYPRERCAHELFEAQAERTPDAVALRHAGGSLTYRELEERANRLARHLHGLGVGPDARVGLCLERGPELMVGVLGILKAGGAYVPLDPAYPAERLAYMLEDSGARVLLTQASLAERLPAGEAAVVRLDADAEEIGREGGGRPGVPVGPGNLAYVIYTSGSTGRPKGVAMPHRPLVNLLAWQESAGRAPAAAVTLQFTSISFDVSFQEIFATWCAGGTLVLTSEEVRADLPRLARLLEAERIERLFLPFIALQHLAEASLELGIAPASLSEVITAGEQLRVTEPIRRWFARMPGCVLVNQYGPSETHVVSARVLEGEPAEWPLLPSIGAPVANTRLYVLDQHLEPAPVGVPGELLLGGDAVARGYLERPDLTAARFVPDPFGEPGGRLYRTGDRARWLPGGEVEFLGRTDEQVKVRGFRIEPGEVEAVLLDHPDVREAVAVVREDAPGDRRLVAYVVAGEPAAVTPAELRAHLKGRLPEYMVPSAVVVLESLPLTPSGKVARRALPAPEYAAAEETYVAPRTPVEEALAGIWAEVLRLERVGAESDFFALGGHSLLATRVISRVRVAFGVELPLRALFEDSTVAGLAERIVRLRGENLGTQPPPILPVPRDGRPLPLSFAQQRLWFVDRLHPGRIAYNMPSRMRVRGVLDLAALERALSEVVRRHESLRTRFPMHGGEPVQQVDPAGPVRLPVVDLGGLREEAREVEVERLAAAEARRPFDLAAGPLLRGAVLRLADDDAVVLVTLHHIVSDGWSMGIVVRELSTLYEAFSRGEEARFPDLPIQYADYAVWQREWLSGEVLQAQTGYWRARLAGAPALLELPTDRPRPLVPGDAGASVGFTIGAETAAALRRLSRREGATMFMTLLAAWQLLLSRYSGHEDVVVGSPIAGRNRLETEGLIGFFINTLVLRADLSGDPGFGELLHRVRESTLGAYQHQDLPFEKLVEELGAERSQAYTPLFQVMFVLQNNESSQLRLGDAAVEHRGGALGAVKFDLSLSLQETAEEIRGVLSYRTELWMEASIRRMVEHYARVLEAVAAHPELKLSQVPLLGEEERARLLAESGAPGHPCPEGLLHELFERQAARTPGAVALVLGEDSLSYGELDRRANRLARHLLGRGVGPEVRVAVFLERSFEMVIAVLAILKAGGAYVPLDPTYPAERLAYQVQDSGATLLVTTGALLDQLGSTSARPVLVDAEAGAIGGESDAPPPRAATPENLAYVVYTSGSTGRPKGVMAPHRGVVSYLASLVQEYGLAPGDVVLQRSTLSFDASVRDLLGPLTAGARVVLVHTHEAADPVLLMRRIREHRVNVVLAIVPSVLRPLLDAAEEMASPPALRLLLSSGEPLAVADCHRARRAFGSGLRVVNLWGPTECTMTSSFHTVGEEDGEGIAPVGVPIPNTRIHVLDARMQPVPAGVAGEAYIAGVGLARGYRNQPGLTAERFLPDPFAAAPGARIYRVGDRVRRRADGGLEFLGRFDQQVKVRGIRVETGEVEAVLRAQAGVRDAVVVAQEAAPGETRLVAYVAGEEEALEAGALRSALERTLPAHMIPSVLVRLAALPLLPNGKVNRAALPAPVSDAWRDGEGYVAPSTPTERVLVEIWESLLDVRPIGVDDPFFRLGGHSMLAVRLMTQIRRRLGVEVPLAALFEQPTVRGLAARVEGEPGPRPGSPLVAIQPHGDRVPIFFVHPVGGEVLCYADLARALGPEQPFYGLQAGGLAQLGEEEASIEEMAARYVAAIREVRPNGPYLLGGWSFGGFVAFEMAQQLTRAGEPVPLVAMVDTRSPGERRPADLDPCILLAGMARADAQAAGKEISLTADDLRPLGPDARIARALYVLRAAGVDPGDVEVGGRAAFLRGAEVRMRSALRYAPKPYSGRIALFVPSERFGGPEFRPLDASAPGWEAYASEPLLKQTVPGHHNSMVRGENAAVLAGHLGALAEESLLAAHV